jgi:four helix bundle protein
MPFLFEKLAAYQQSLRIAELSEEIRKEARSKVSRNLLDQFCRAALSIPLNLAEGNGRWHTAEKKHFFWIARGSAFECVPILEILYRSKTITDKKYEECYACLEEISKTISGMIKSIHKS